MNWSDAGFSKMKLFNQLLRRKTMLNKEDARRERPGNSVTTATGNCTSQSHCIEIYSGSKVIGEVNNGDTFQKRLESRRHFLRRPSAIALSLDSLEQAEKAGALFIKIIDLDSGRVFWTIIEHMRNKGFIIQRGGFEPQLALRLKDWSPKKPALEKQFSLF
jgi:hypothetical protein